MTGGGQSVVITKIGSKKQVYVSMGREGKGRMQGGSS